MLTVDVGSGETTLKPGTSLTHNAGFTESPETTPPSSSSTNSGVVLTSESTAVDTTTQISTDQWSEKSVVTHEVEGETDPFLNESQLVTTTQSSVSQSTLTLTSESTSGSDSTLDTSEQTSTPRMGFYTTITYNNTSSDEVDPTVDSTVISTAVDDLTSMLSVLSTTTSSPSTSTSTTMSTTTRETTATPTTPTTTSTTTTSTTTTSTTTTPTTTPTTTSPPELGDLCSEDSNCDSIQNSQCKTVCTCKDDFYQSKSKCRRASRITPTNVTATLTGHNIMRVEWSVYKPSDVNYTLVTANTSNDGKKFTLDTNNRSVAFSDLLFGSIYDVTVTTFTSYGSSFSSTVSILTRPNVVPNITIKAMEDTLSVSWTPLIYPDDVIYYIIRFNNDVRNTTSSNVTFKGEYESCYNVSVSATNSAGEGQSLDFRKATKSGKPEAVTDMNVSEGTIDANLSWGKPKITHGNITKYSIDVTSNLPLVSRVNLSCADCTKPCDEDMLIALPTEGSNVFKSGQETFTIEITGLIPYTTYNVTVIAFTADKEGISASLRFTTRQGIPGKVRNLRLTEPSDVKAIRALNITWDPPLPEEQRGVITGYKINASCGATYEAFNTSETYLRLNNKIKPECLYHIEVNAATVTGDGPKVSQSFRTSAGAPPTPRSTASKSIGKVADPKHQIALRIPRDILCDFSQGKITHWGILVHRSSYLEHKSTSFRGLRNNYIVSPSLVALNRSLETVSCRNTATHVVVGDGRCNERTCNNPLTSDTGYRFVVFICTTTACTESFPSEIIYTEPEDSNSVLIGVVIGVVFIVLGVFGGVVFYKLWKKRESVRPSVHFDRATIELGTKKSSLIPESQKSRPIKLQNLADHVEHLHRDSNLGFSEEYKVLKQLSPKYLTKAAEQQACRTKNRYTNVLPFDHTRVKLLSQDDEEGSDYINANFLTGYTCKREYIAAQGPLPCTKDDFWRMIWEHRIGMVVMLTQCKERGRIKCEKYWPDNNDPVYFGDLIVQLRSESVLPDYVIRILDVKQGNKKRVVRHFHFLKWPDFGCPEKTWLLLNFVSAVRAHMPHHQEGPTLVHCSAGVGRTGTFIAVDYLLQDMKDNNEIDIFGFVLQMRESRPLMVQTENQYIFIHDCIRDALQEDTDEEAENDEEEEEEDEHIYQNT